MSEEVVVKIFNSESDARMAQDVLKDEGVPAFVFKDDGGGMEPHLQRTTGVRLVVKPVDAERATRYWHLCSGSDFDSGSMADRDSVKTRLSFEILP